MLNMVSKEDRIIRREPAMNENTNVIVTDEDGRWDDEAWLTEQAEIFAMQDAFENGIGVG